jgi:hypothetical protein
MKVLPNIRAETIARIIYNEIIIVYGPPKELFLDNNRNLIGDVIKAYTTFLFTKYKVIISYYFRTNGKVENFNGFLG